MGFVSKIIKNTLMTVFDPENAMAGDMDEMDEDMDDLDEEMDDEMDDDMDEEDMDDDEMDNDEMDDDTDEDDTDDTDDADDGDVDDVEDDDGGMVISSSMNRGARVSFGGYTPAQCARTTSGTQNYCPFAGSGR